MILNKESHFSSETQYNEYVKQHHVYIGLAIYINYKSQLRELTKNIKDITTNTLVFLLSFIITLMLGQKILLPT